MSSKRLTRREITARLDVVFRAAGYDGASLDMLANAVGLNRGSLYYHFPGGKAEMADAVLLRSGMEFSRLILAPLALSGSALGRFEDMKHGVLEYYAGEPPICLMNSLTLGSGKDLFAPRVSDAVSSWQTSLAVLAEEIGQTAPQSYAREVISTIQGGLILARVHDSRTQFEAIIDDLKI